MTKADSSEAREDTPCLPSPILVELFSHNEATAWGVLADSYADNTRPAAGNICYYYVGGFLARGNV
jgi:hypothetical protein